MRAEHIGSGPMASPRTLPLQGSSAIGSGGCRRFDVLVPKLGLQQILFQFHRSQKQSQLGSDTARGIVEDVLDALRRHRAYRSRSRGPEHYCLEDFFEKHLSEAKIVEIAARFAVPTKIKHAQKVTKDCSYCMMLYVRHVLSVR